MYFMNHNPFESCCLIYQMYSQLIWANHMFNNAYVPGDTRYIIWQYIDNNDRQYRQVSNIRRTLVAN